MPSSLPSPLSDIDPGSTSSFAHQVAGHQNVMSDESGDLVIKPALPREIAFYQLLASASRSSALARLRGFVPRSYGTLRLEGQIDTSGGVNKEGISGQTPESVVLENLAKDFTHPCVLDVKLGTVLHSSDATEEKKQRMEKQAIETTSRETGIRLTGCQTWHVNSSSYILTPKSFGKSIGIQGLSTGMTRFFPLPSDVIPSLILPLTPPPSSTGTTPGSLNLPLPSSEPIQSTNSLLQAAPIKSSSDQAASSSALQPSTHLSARYDTPSPSVSLPKSQQLSEYTNHAIPPSTMARLLTLTERKIEELERVMSQLEARFIGSSVLIVYEGDPDRLLSALEREESKCNDFEQEEDMGFGADPDESDDIDFDLLSDSESDSEEDSVDEDGVKADARRARRCPPMSVKLIDFAHTSLTQGEGPDEGVLLGLKTLKGLVKDRREVVLPTAASSSQADLKAASAE